MALTFSTILLQTTITAAVCFLMSLWGSKGDRSDPYAFHRYYPFGDTGAILGTLTLLLIVTIFAHLKAIESPFALGFLPVVGIWACWLGDKLTPFMGYELKDTTPRKLVVHTYFWVFGTPCLVIAGICALIALLALCGFGPDSSPAYADHMASPSQNDADWPALCVYFVYGVAAAASCLAAMFRTVIANSRNPVTGRQLDVEARQIKEIFLD